MSTDEFDMLGGFLLIIGIPFLTIFLAVITQNPLYFLFNSPWFLFLGFFFKREAKLNKESDESFFNFMDSIPREIYNLIYSGRSEGFIIVRSKCPLKPFIFKRVSEFIEAQGGEYVTDSSHIHKERFDSFWRVPFKVETASLESAKKEVEKK